MGLPEASKIKMFIVICFEPSDDDLVCVLRLANCGLFIGDALPYFSWLETDKPTKYSIKNASAKYILSRPLLSLKTISSVCFNAIKSTLYFSGKFLERSVPSEQVWGDSLYCINFKQMLPNCSFLKKLGQDVSRLCGLI